MGKAKAKRGATRTPDPKRREALEGQSLLKAAEVAILLNVSLRTVWSLASARRLRPIKVGPKATRFRREDVRKLIERP